MARNGNGGMNKPPRTIHTGEIEKSLEGVDKRIDAILNDPARKAALGTDVEFSALKTEKLQLQQRLEGVKGGAASKKKPSKSTLKTPLVEPLGFDALAGMQSVSPNAPQNVEGMTADIEAMNRLHSFVDSARDRAAEGVGKILQEEADAEEGREKNSRRPSAPKIDDPALEMPGPRDTAAIHFDTLRDAAERPSEELGVKDYIISPRPIDTDATPKESRDALKDLLAKARNKDLTRDIAAPRNTLTVEERRKARAEIKETRKELQAKAEEAQETYLTLLREYHKNKKGHQVLIDGIHDFAEKDFAAPEAVRQAKRRWINARAEYAQETSLLIGEYLGDNRNKYDAHAGVQLIRETFIKPQEAAIEARMEGLALRDKNALDKVVAWYKNIPPEVRVPATFALMSIGSTTLAAFGGAFSLAPLIVGGGLVAAQTALHFAASRQKDPVVKARLSKIASALTLGGLAGMLTSAGIKGLDSKLNLVKDANTSFRDMTSFKEARAFEKQHEKVGLHKENVERVAGLAGAAASIGVGSMFGHWLRGFGGGSGATEAAGAAHTDVPHKTGWSLFGNKHTDSAGTEHTPPAHPKEVPPTDTQKPPEAPPAAPPAPPAPAVEAYSTAIDQRGEGAAALLKDIREHYASLYPDPSKAPGALRTILEAKNPADMARTLYFNNADGTQMHFIDPKTGESILMKEGDTIGINADGNLTLTNETGNFNYLHHEQPEVAPAEAQKADVHQEVAPAHTDATHEDPSDALNRGQLHQPEVSTHTGETTPDEGVQVADTVVAPLGDAQTTPPATAEFVQLHPAAPEALPHAPASDTTEVAAPEAPVTSLNVHEVPVDPTVPHRYELPNHQMVVWGGDDFQKQLDFANKFIEEQRALGNNATIFVARVFPGDSSPSLIELNTQGGDTMYRPDELPFPPFGKDDFIKLIK